MPSIELSAGQALDQITEGLRPFRRILALEDALKVAIEAAGAEDAHRDRLAQIRETEARMQAHVDALDAKVQAANDRCATIIGEAHAEAEKITKTAQDDGQRAVNAMEIQAKALIEKAQAEVAGIHAAAKQATADAMRDVADAKVAAHKARTEATEVDKRVVELRELAEAEEARLAKIREAIAALTKG